MTYFPRDIICMPIDEMPKYWRQPLTPSTRLPLDILHTLPTLPLTTFLYYPTSSIRQHHAGQEWTHPNSSNKATSTASNNTIVPLILPLPSSHKLLLLLVLLLHIIFWPTLLNYCCIFAHRRSRNTTATTPHTSIQNITHYSTIICRRYGTLPRLHCMIKSPMAVGIAHK